jgi:hypothetical protein
MAGESYFPRYDVFISHCGEDCKRDFAVWLKLELEKAGLQCFLDEGSLKAGANAPDRMLNAMQTAKYGIVILSPGFFRREWCIKELQTFVDRERIVPIFLSKFSDVAAAKAAAIKERVWVDFKRFEISEDQYKQAVDAAFNFTGLRLEAVDGMWDRCIYSAKRELISLIDKVEKGNRISDDKLLVGHHKHLPKLKELLGLQVQQEAAAGGAAGCADPQEIGIVGVYGMGGIGKSTLARRLFDDSEVRDWFKFDSMVWVEVGQKDSGKRVCNLQQQILSKLCGDTLIPGNPKDGRVLIRSRLSRRRVLVVLDDVWRGGPNTTLIQGKEDLYILGKEDLGPGSRILKTSRDKATIGGKKYELDVLTPELSWELFCSCAQFEEQQVKELGDLALKAVKRCGGLPLALTVLGTGVLNCDGEAKTVLEEVCIIPGSEESPLAECYAVLKSSYNQLTDKWKAAFCLIAGLWPSTFNFREYGRLVQNLGAALYPDQTVTQQYVIARKALKALCDRSFLEEKRLTNREHFNLDWLLDGFYQVTVHDILAEFATSIIGSEDTPVAGHVVVNKIKDPPTPVVLPWGPVSSLVVNVHSKPLLELSGTIEGLKAYGTCSLLVLTRFGESNAEGIGRSTVCTRCLTYILLF